MNEDTREEDFDEEEEELNCFNYDDEISPRVLWARRELQIIEETCEDEDDLRMQKHMTENIMTIIEVFDEQGHSGFSANYAIGKIYRLLRGLPLLPLTGEDKEWDKPHTGAEDENLQQNLRCTEVFRKNFDNSTAFWIHGKVFSDDGGKSWYTSRESHVSVAFPYNVPDSPEYIILTEEEKIKEKRRIDYEFQINKRRILRRKN